MNHPTHRQDKVNAERAKLPPETQRRERWAWLAAELHAWVDDHVAAHGLNAQTPVEYEQNLRIRIQTLKRQRAWLIWPGNPT